MPDIPQAELHVGEAVLLGQQSAFGHHVGVQVHPHDPAPFPHPAVGQEDVNARAGAQVQDSLALFELRQGGGVATARAQNRGLRHRLQVLGGTPHGQVLVHGNEPAGGAAEGFFPPADLAAAPRDDPLNTFEINFLSYPR